MSRSSRSGSASASVAKTARTWANASSNGNLLLVRDAIDELVERHPARAPVDVHLAALERLGELLREDRLEVVDLAAGEALAERLEHGVGGALGLDAIEPRPLPDPVDERAERPHLRLGLLAQPPREVADEGLVLVGQLVDQVVDLVGRGDARQRAEHDARVVGRRAGVDLLALGDAPEELLDAEALGPVLRVGEPLAQALGEVLGELLRTAAGDPLGERDERGHGGALGVVAVEPRLPLDLGEEALVAPRVVADALAPGRALLLIGHAPSGRPRGGRVHAGRRWTRRGGGLHAGS